MPEGDELSGRYRSLCQRAGMLIDVGRPQEALVLVEEASRLEPEHSEAPCRMAQALLALERPADAARHAKRAVALDPEDEWALRLLSLGERRSGNGREGLRAAEEAARLAPDLSETLHVLALAQLDLRKVDLAHQTSERLVALAPENPVAHEVAGLVALERRRWKQAEEHWRRALALAPEEERYLNNLGVALLEQNRIRDALDQFHGALKLDPTFAVFRENLERTLKRHLSLANAGVLVTALVELVLLQSLWSGELFDPADSWEGILSALGFFGGWSALTVVAAVVWRRRRAELHPVLRQVYDEHNRRERLKVLVSSGPGLALRLTLVTLLCFPVAIVMAQSSPLGWILMLLPAVLAPYGVEGLRELRRLERTPPPPPLRERALDLLANAWTIVIGAVLAARLMLVWAGFALLLVVPAAGILVRRRRRSQGQDAGPH